MGPIIIRTFHLIFLFPTQFLGLRVPTICIQMIGTEGVIDINLIILCVHKNFVIIYVIELIKHRQLKFEKRI